MQPIDLVDGGHLGRVHRLRRAAREREGAHARGAAEKLDDVQLLRSGQELLDGAIAFGHHTEALASVGPSNGTRSTSPLGAPCRERRWRVVSGVQLDLGDARQLLAQLVGVLLCGSAQLVEVDLLVERHVRRRALAAARVARVLPPSRSWRARRRSSSRRARAPRNRWRCGRWDRARSDRERRAPDPGGRGPAARRGRGRKISAAGLRDKPWFARHPGVTEPRARKRNRGATGAQQLRNRPASPLTPPRPPQPSFQPARERHAACSRTSTSACSGRDEDQQGLRLFLHRMTFSLPRR